MKDLSFYKNQHWDVIVIGGGATGVGTLRDLSMRGFKTLLLEQQDLAYGTTSRFHGLLHSGARYVMKDQGVATDCAKENIILSKICKPCIENIGGLFIRTNEDEPEFEKNWVTACNNCKIKITPISITDALKEAPTLSKHILSAYKVPDASIDGFKLVWHNVISAQKYGGEFRTYTKVTSITNSNGVVTGVTIEDFWTKEITHLTCNFVINAAGSWCGAVAAKAGIELHLTPNKGALIVFNHRFSKKIINRLRPPSDGDIFVPHESTTILGTTSKNTNRPDDTVPEQSDILELLKIGSVLFPKIHQYRILRSFAGTRPLYSMYKSPKKLYASRSFRIVDHKNEGLSGMASICGGKVTTYRLMAEQISNLVCNYFNKNVPCNTAKEPLIPETDPTLHKKIIKYFPVQGFEPALSRLGNSINEVSTAIKNNLLKKDLICECEMVTFAEVEYIANQPSSYLLGDICRRTRMGMGTCQGTFCALRAIGDFLQSNLLSTKEPITDLLQTFQQKKWIGIYPSLWGETLREVELFRQIYSATLNIDQENHE